MDYRNLPEDSVLCPTRDEQLIKGLEGYAKVAGIGGHPEYIWQSVKNNETITEEDITLTQRLPLKREDRLGAVYIGYSLTKLTRKFMALTGLILRNYINAKYITRHALLTDIQEGLDVEGSIIFCPDFYIKSKKGHKNSPLPQWRKDILMSFFLEKQSEGVDIVLGIYNWSTAEEHYGSEIMSFLENNFVEVG